MDKYSIGVLGSIAIDNIFTCEAVPTKGQRVFGNLLGSFVGGIGANQAMELSRYLSNVYMLGQIGDDDFGTIALKQLNQRGVYTDRIQRISTPTGQTYMYLVDNRSDYFSVVAQNANKSGLYADESFYDKWIDGLDLVLVSLEINYDIVLQTLHAAKRHGVEVWLSPSPAECCTQEILALADNIILNKREAQTILGLKYESKELFKVELKKFDCRFKYVLVSAGAQGAFLKVQDQVCFAEALDIPAIDSVGAGDALAGTFLASKLLGFSDYEALCFGCIAGSLTVNVNGAQTSLHDLKRVREIFEKNYLKGDEK